MLGKSTVPTPWIRQASWVDVPTIGSNLGGSSNHSTKVEGRPGAAFKIIYNSKDQSVSCEHA